MTKAYYKIFFSYSCDVIVVAVAASLLCLWEMHPQTYINFVLSSYGSVVLLAEGINWYNMLQSFVSASFAGVLVAAILKQKILWLAPLPAVAAGLTQAAFAVSKFPGASYHTLHAIVIFIVYGSGGIFGTVITYRFLMGTDSKKREKYRLWATAAGIALSAAVACYHLGFIRGTVNECSSNLALNVRLLGSVNQRIEEQQYDEAKDLLKMQLQAYRRGLYPWLDSPFLSPFLTEDDRHLLGDALQRIDQ